MFTPVLTDLDSTEPLQLCLPELLLLPADEATSEVHPGSSPQPARPGSSLLSNSMRKRHLLLRQQQSTICLQRQGRKKQKERGMLEGRDRRSKGDQRGGGEADVPVGELEGRGGSVNESGRDERVRDGSEGEGRQGRWDRKVWSQKERGRK